MNNIEVVVNAMIAGVAVFGIWYTMREGEVFEWLGFFFDRLLGDRFEKLKSAVFECPVCMFPYYGSLFYLFVLNWGRTLSGEISIREMILVVIFGVGFNAIVNSAVTFFIEASKQIHEHDSEEW